MIYNRRYSRIQLESEPEKNILSISGTEHFLESMDIAGIGPRGANATILRAMSADSDKSFVVKFCKFPLNSTLPKEQIRIKRFKREIEALRIARESNVAECVVPIVEDGILPLEYGNGYRNFIYYVMEEADFDLTRYLEEHEIGFQQQVALCNELLKILKNLHSIGIYHRDIKPDNILMFGNQPCFGDLGLIAYREQDQNSDLDRPDERIGPVGLLSPEATNKYLGLKNKCNFNFDCQIDEKSDIFQLGQVFWMILQSEIPTGHLADMDVRFPHSGLFSSVIQPMLQYGKQRRSDLRTAEIAMLPILKDLALA